jgi:hypothetical protein
MTDRKSTAQPAAPRHHGDQPPVAMELFQAKHLGGLLVHKERQNSSRFIPGVAPQLEKLPALRGVLFLDLF